MKFKKSLLLSIISIFTLVGCSLNGDNPSGGSENQNSINQGGTDYSKATFKYRVGDGDFVTLNDENSTQDASFNDYCDFYYKFLVSNAKRGDAFKMSINGSMVSLSIAKEEGNNLTRYSGSENLQFVEAAATQLLSVYKIKDLEHIYAFAEIKGSGNGGQTTHTHCPGCGAEDVTHSICEFCEQYVCNGENHDLRPCGLHHYCVPDNLDHSKCNTCDGYLCDGQDHHHGGGVTHTHCPGCGAEDVTHNICPYCGEYECNGDNHGLRPCGLHHYCVPDSLNHSACSECSGYLCDGGDHNHEQGGGDEYHICPGCHEENIDHGRCLYCGVYKCVGDHSNCPPDKPPYTGTPNNTTFTYEFHYDQTEYYPYQDPILGTWSYGYAHVSYDITWVITLNADGTGSLQGLLGGVFPILTCDFSFTNNNGIATLTISSYTRLADLQTGEMETVTPSSPVTTTAYLFSDNTAGGLIEFMDHLGAFDPIIA